MSIVIVVSVAVVTALTTFIYSVGSIVSTPAVVVPSNVIPATILLFTAVTNTVVEVTLATLSTSSFISDIG